jgi:hypothetical protein
MGTSPETVVAEFNIAVEQAVSVKIVVAFSRTIRADEWGNDPQLRAACDEAVQSVSHSARSGPRMRPRRWCRVRADVSCAAVMLRSVPWESPLLNRLLVRPAALLVARSEAQG